MFNKILVAIDTSETSDRVFQQAMVIAKATGARLMLLHVLSSEEQGSPYLPIIFSGSGYAGGDKIIENYREEWNFFAQQCLESLKSRQQEAISNDIKAEYAQHPGSPGKTICDFAHNWEADTIVIGHRGHSGLSKLILGSVSNYVLHHAHCSILVVQ